MLRRMKRHFAYKGFIIDPTVQRFFAGRIWSRQQQIVSQTLLEQHIARGFFDVFAAIEEQRGRYRCRRCQTTDRRHFVTFYCAYCEQRCVYCRHCLTMGRMSRCTELISWRGPSVRWHPRATLAFQGQLTARQQQAAHEVAASIAAQRDHLLVAVCGAGKTEVLFQPVATALQRRLRVCVATPRTDVVLELYPRFQAVLPTATIQALYGGTDVAPIFAELVIATTHQLYRFEHAFDVMIVDEADAFPYTLDEALQRAVEKARKKAAPIVYVTATPSTTFKRRMAKKQIAYSFIAKRYHNYPLPVPRFQSLFRYAKQIGKGVLPAKLRAWIEARLTQQQPFLIFFPTIELMEQALPLVQQLDEAVAAVHADDEQRKEKVLALRNEQLKGLLTTTILERGITIRNVQVAVVGAESAIFTSSALIQISGRVGRHAQHPTGDICFFHHGITVEMDEAVKEIRALNKQVFGGAVT